MFTTSSVLGSVRTGDYAFKIDLQDAYFHVPIHPSSRKYLRFRKQGVPVSGATLRSEHRYLHRQVISMIPYLDDWLIHHPDHQVLFRHQAQLINTLDLVGFILNRKKSELDLTQDLQFLGIRLRLDLGEASLPESKACSRTPSILPPNTNLFSSVPAYGVTQLSLRSYPSGSFVPKTPSTSFSLIRSD